MEHQTNVCLTPYSAVSIYCLVETVGFSVSRIVANRIRLSFFRVIVKNFSFLGELLL